ncbi:hypothetical protein EXIGLDRAFT_718899 [Exidia glandulosa HHB12029]|uniref:Uncharacterized protein n=1 Tax=Exidia glandulosa HHB12029 TaxID=1314781 RepID=A0A165HF58_EXIGL|nr:hypothetical protein EXIGLDRAFT_718899 [Exidia glandulosa HHB12029]
MDFTGSTPDVVPEPAEPAEQQQEGGLRRTPSIGSSRSDTTSLYSSASSVGSMSSLSSSGSSRRIVVPLYNLSAHNVMTNAVLDAGTDAKIAKFLKRGLELIDLCVIEPVEMWSSPGHVNDNASLVLAERVGSPVPSMESSEQQHVETTPTPAATKRSRFTSLFTRKDANRSQSALTPPTGSPAPVKTRSATSPVPPPEQISAPVLGLQSTIYSSVYPPVGKSPSSIVWIVRKWIKGADTSLLANLRIGNSDRGGRGGVPQPTVRFEWVRSTARSNTGDTHSRFPTDLTASRRSSRIAPAPAEEGRAPPTAAGVVSSLPASPKSLDFSLPESGDQQPPAPETASHTESTTDAGDESDPEDSETPWTCTLVISTPGNVSPAPSDTSPSPSSRRASMLSTDNAHKGGSSAIRLRLATLAPTPHHPKVVAQLKIPWPLPDVDVMQGVLHKRSPLGRPASVDSGAGPSLIVTAEEMKDVVCATAFWMIVREGFGGVGKKTRKGDGWRIRG